MHSSTSVLYTLSLHDALPILLRRIPNADVVFGPDQIVNVPSLLARTHQERDRKSTRLNSSHANISYAVFCLKKKKHYQTKNYISDQSYSTVLTRNLHHINRWR